MASMMAPSPGHGNITRRLIIAALVRADHPAWLRRRVIRLGRFDVFEGQDAGFKPRRLPLGKGVVIPWEQPPVERVGDDTAPAQMEMMEDTPIDARPVVHWHYRALHFR
jgi:hypothetical protein